MKLHIVIQDGTSAGHQVQCEEGSLLIGRAEDCLLRFDAEQDRLVSNHHAVIQKANDGFYITDQNSTNGTLLNGKRIRQARLASGDVVQFGNQGPRILITLEGAQDRELLQAITERSFYNPEKDRQTNYTGTIVAVGITFVLISIVLFLLLANLGFDGAVVGAFMAFLPAPVYLFTYLWMDRYDPEPPWAIALAFAWGALFSILVSFVVNTVFGSVVETIAGKPAGMTLSAILSAPFIEELTKGSGVMLAAVFLRKEFDGVLDGIVYAGVIGLGFATVENVLYYGGTYVQAGAGALLATGFLRGVLSPFIHSFFTSMTGIGCGLARESHNKFAHVVFPLLGLCAAMGLHSLWNLSASLMGGFFFVAYLFLWVPLFVMFLGLIFLMARREKKIIRRTLSAEEGGLLSTDELELAGSLRRRFQWLLSSGNWRLFIIRRRYLHALTRLAFCYWHAERAASANSQTISLQQIPHFRSEIARLKPLI